MKNWILAVSLLVLTGTANAAGNDKKESLPQNEQSILTSTPAMHSTVTLLLEENNRLKAEAEILQAKLENLSNSLEFSTMMHTSIAALINVADQEKVEELNSKISYMQMMHVTLMNLNKLLVESK